MNTAANDREWRALLASERADFVRTRQQWDELLGSADSPLGGVSDEAAVKAFSDGLVFKGGGLAHADYSMLKESLTRDQIVSLFAHFGISPQLFGDYDGHACTSRANCSTAMDNICMSTCEQTD